MGLQKAEVRRRRSWRTSETPKRMPMMRQTSEMSWTLPPTGTPSWMIRRTENRQWLAPHSRTRQSYQRGKPWARTVRYRGFNTRVADAPECFVSAYRFKRGRRCGGRRRAKSGKCPEPTKGWLRRCLRDDGVRRQICIHVHVCSLPLSA